jgi:hypothetical protein
MVWKILFLVSLLGCGSIAECTTVRKTFMPDNRLDLEDKQQQTNITEDEFNSILDVVEQVYTPIFRNFGATFNLERDWADSTVNAYANQSGKTWTVHMYGGMARRNEMNKAGFGLVACHEVGHHLGGFPKYSDSPWASNEGNSDYFANHVCARKVFESLSVPQIPDYPKAKCDEIYSSQADREYCYKSLDGGQALGNLLGVLNGTGKPNYQTPDGTVVSKTSDSHPRAQCRLDTYLAGTLCTMPWNDAVIPTNESAVCTNRPKCWFKSSGGGGGGDPDPTPTPNPDPDGKADYETMQAINLERMNRRLPQLDENEALTCASYIHASDIGPAGWCSHFGTDNSNFTQRVRSCGYRFSAVELLACKRSSGTDAVQRWLRDRESSRQIFSRQWTGFGCSSNSGYYVCVLGYK